jgi:hypothetical protein
MKSSDKKNDDRIGRLIARPSSKKSRNKPCWVYRRTTGVSSVKNYGEQERARAQASRRDDLCHSG